MRKTLRAGSHSTCGDIRATPSHGSSGQSTGLARRVKVRPHAMNLFRRHLGRTILASITEHRLAHAERLLAIGEQSVLTIALDAGFASPSAFYAAFRQRWSCSPPAYRTWLREP